MTIHEALWFIDELNRIHPENAQHPRHRLTRTCLRQNVHPNQEAFVTSDGNHAQEGEFWGCFSRLKQKKCVESIDRHRIPADAWVWITPFGEETLKLFAQRCPHHYFSGHDNWSRRPADQRCSLVAPPPPALKLSCFCERNSS